MRFMHVLACKRCVETSFRGLSFDVFKRFGVLDVSGKEFKVVYSWQVCATLQHQNVGYSRPGRESVPSRLGCSGVWGVGCLERPQAA